ncbi:MAG: ABC transporter substrate-binding protein [Christensenellales bacterium]|jgi:raffinose/stachyose/melibiose transport system substrate-binding protein
MRKILSVVLVLMMVLSTVCFVSADTVTITTLHSAGGNESHIEYWRNQVAQFSEYTEGKYVVETEEIPGVAVDVRTKLKMLNAANNLPTLVSDLGAEPAFRDLLISNNRLVDLKPYFDASPEWQSTAFPASVAYNTDEEGHMYTAPATSTDYVGIYYNKEMLSAVGYDEFPTTWDDFWACCEALKANGIAPIALHTTETGWCPMLMATAYVATLGEDAGAFLRMNFPSDFNNEYMIAMAECLQKLFQYTTSDAIGGTYSLASNNFCASKAAMIANGPWMAASFYDTQYAPEGFAEKVGYAPFPGGIMLTDEGESYGYGVSADSTEEQIEAAVEFIKFQAIPEQIIAGSLEFGSFSHLVPMGEEDISKLSPILQSAAEAVTKCTGTAPRYQGKWDSVVQTEVIEQELPNLAMNLITPEEFVNKMTEGAQRYLTETQS